ncbi:MAG TPA: CsgG/HfaB family protein [Smithellaceae bacterium]|nr:CsgG/HfaB family protein [Smithellaceae bacterium]
MKKLFPAAILLLLLLSGCASSMIHKINFSQDYSPAKVRCIAILNFNRGTSVPIQADILTDKFTVALVNSRFKIVDRTDMKKIMDEARFQYTDGIIDEKTKQKLKQLGADTILTGTLQAYQEDKRNNFIHESEAYLTAKLLRVETGEVLWSAEILKKSKAKNVGEKKLLSVIDRESEAEPASKLLDDIITEMADSFKEKKSLTDKLKIW